MQLNQHVMRITVLWNCLFSYNRFLNCSDIISANQQNRKLQLLEYFPVNNPVQWPWPQIALKLNGFMSISFVPGSTLGLILSDVLFHANVNILVVPCISDRWFLSSLKTALSSPLSHCLRSSSALLSTTKVR